MAVSVRDRARELRLRFRVAVARKGNAQLAGLLLVRVKALRRSPSLSAMSFLLLLAGGRLGVVALLLASAAHGVAASVATGLLVMVTTRSSGCATCFLAMVLFAGTARDCSTRRHQDNSLGVTRDLGIQHGQKMRVQKHTRGAGDVTADMPSEPKHT